MLSEKFKTDGYCVIDNIELNINQEFIGKKVFPIAMNNFNELMNYISINNLDFGIGIKNGYKEIVQRHINRYEMPYKMDNEIFDFVLHNKILKEMISKVLECDDYIVVNRSLVISLPGCEDQKWHSDGPHMSTIQYLSCHCLNVFIPLIDINEQNGPTEFKPGSHYYTNDLTKSLLLAMIKKTIRTPVKPSLTKGSALLFDYRVLHRGIANKTDNPRPILVFTFAKPWYKDTLNFPHKSVFSQDNYSAFHEDISNNIILNLPIKENPICDKEYDII